MFVIWLVTAFVAIACAGSATPVSTVTGTVVAAPTCPTESAPGSSPDPGCSPAPVEGAELLVLDDSGAEVATVTSDAAGRYTLELPPGTYRLEPQPLPGYPTTPDAVRFTVLADEDATIDVITYDTGIR